MSYRKDKKMLTKLLKVAIDIQDANPLSNSAAGQVRSVRRLLRRLWLTKYGNTA